MIKQILITLAVLIDMGIVGPFMISHRSYELPIIWIVAHLGIFGFLLYKADWKDKQEKINQQIKGK